MSGSAARQQGFDCCPWGPGCVPEQAQDHRIQYDSIVRLSRAAQEQGLTLPLVPGVCA
jgi:hypothetical protein